MAKKKKNTNSGALTSNGEAHTNSTTIPLSRELKKKLYYVKIKHNFATWDEVLERLLSSWNGDDV